MIHTNQRIRIADFDSLTFDVIEVDQNGKKVLGIEHNNKFVPLGDLQTYTYLSEDKNINIGGEEKMPIELKVEEQLEVPDGEKTGVITKVEERTEPYHYIDVYMTCEGYDIELKAGFPATIRPTTKLGKTLKKFVDLTEVMGKKIDLEKTLVGKKVKYLTMTEETDRGTFVRVVDDSLKPLKDPSKELETNLNHSLDQGTTGA